MHAGNCGHCGVEMRVHRETASAWVFRCPRCGLLNCVTKRLIGGTRGAGGKDDGSTGIPGRGPRYPRGVVR